MDWESFTSWFKRGLTPQPKVLFGSEPIIVFKTETFDNLLTKRDLEIFRLGIPNLISSGISLLPSLEYAGDSNSQIILFAEDASARYGIHSKTGQVVCIYGTSIKHQGHSGIFQFDILNSSFELFLETCECIRNLAPFSSIYEINQSGITEMLRNHLEKAIELIDPTNNQAYWNDWFPEVSNGEFMLEDYYFQDNE